MVNKKCRVRWFSAIALAAILAVALAPANSALALDNEKLTNSQDTSDPLASGAKSNTYAALDFTNPSLIPTGSGFCWDADTNTLSLSGVTIEGGSAQAAITVPDNTTIVLTEGTENFVSAAQGMGIYATGGTLTITGTGYLSIQTQQEDGIGSYGNLSLKGGCSVDVEAGKNGLYSLSGSIGLSEGAIVCVQVLQSGVVTGIGFNDDGVISVRDKAMLLIDAGEDGITAGNRLEIDGAAKIDVNAGNNALFGESGVIIKDSACISVTNCQQGIYSEESVVLQNTPIDVTATNGCISSHYGKVELASINNLQLDASDSGIAVLAPSVEMTSCSGSITNAGRALEATGASGNILLSNTTLDIAAQEFCTASSLSLEQGTSVSLASQTTACINTSETWSVDAASSLKGGATFENGGTLTVDGTFTNNGTFTALEGSTLDGSGQLQASKDATVILCRSASQDEQQRLSQLGSLQFVTENALDFVLHPQAAQGDGYAWDPSTKTLTLSGAVINVAESEDAGDPNADVPAVRLPQGARIYLQEGTASSITTKADTSAVIQCEGDVEVCGTGSLSLQGNAQAMNVAGALKVYGPTVSSSAFSGFVAQRIDIAHSRMAASSQSGPCLFATEQLTIAKSSLRLTTEENPLIEGDSVLRVSADSKQADPNSLVIAEGLPQGFSVQLFEDDVLGLWYAGLADESGLLVKSVEIDGYEPLSDPDPVPPAEESTSGLLVGTPQTLAKTGDTPFVAFIGAIALAALACVGTAGSMLRRNKTKRERSQRSQPERS